MSDLILSLPHCNRHITIYVAQIVDMILGRVFYGICILYIAVRCGFTTVQ